MAYVITSGCVCCASCVAECPVNAIVITDTQVEIQTDKCISCGTCASICPAGAIEAEA